MDVEFEKDFDDVTLNKGRRYALNERVSTVEKLENGSILSVVTNSSGKRYKQIIQSKHGKVFGACTCPMSFNCKHVAAALIHMKNKQKENEAKGIARTQDLSSNIFNWLEQLKQTTESSKTTNPEPETYSKRVHDRLLYVLQRSDKRLKIETFKGRINAAGTGLNKTIRQYDALNALRYASPAKFILPTDRDLLDALAKTGILQARSSYNYGSSYPTILKPKKSEVVRLLWNLADTGRFLWDNDPNTVLQWSEYRPELNMKWSLLPNGSQRLGFADETGNRLELYHTEGASIWLDTSAGLIGELDGVLSPEVLTIVETSPLILPHQTGALSDALPKDFFGISVPKPRLVKTIQKPAERCVAKLVLGREAARVGPRSWDSVAHLPTLDLTFLYDGQEVQHSGPDPIIMNGDELIKIIRDREWEQDCAARLLDAGAIPVSEISTYWPSARLKKCGYAFANGEYNPHTDEICSEIHAMNFAFMTVPYLQKEGWEVEITAKWPFKFEENPAELAVHTERMNGEAFQGNDWFALGFKAEVNGKNIDVAPVIANFIKNLREDWQELPSVADIQDYLDSSPFYIDLGKEHYVAVNLSPLAPLLHLVLSYHAELGALHPSDASVARLAEEALAGSSVKFSDNAGILPLARSLEALAQAKTFEAPKGLTATLRDYQAFGAAWMGSLLNAQFGAVLADDMGLGKTIQALALFQARCEAGASGPVLLIVPTSLLHSWQSQATQFTPNLRVVVLHGTNRADNREASLDADLVVTTYPLLARDISWLSEQKWPLVVLDEAQTLKNPASQMAKSLRQISSVGRIALTGTPLENSLQDLWTLIDWVNPGLLGDRKKFQSMFRTPIEKHGDASAQARLNRRLRPFLLRRTKDEVAAELPPKTEILERVSLPKAQQALYEAVRSAMDERVRKAIQQRGLARARITVLDALLKLRQVCCDPSLVKTKAAQHVTDSAKRDRLRSLLAELVAEGRRVLVFSQFVEMLKLIETDLHKSGIKTLTLTGSTKNRSEVLESFSQGNASVFLLSLKAGGVGLTLTEADTVILYDPWWNPAVERQAMDRAHRIGQDKPVFVHRLVAAGTVEEKILDMQVRKQALADALFNNESDGSTTLLDEATLQDLFAPLV